MKVHFQRIVLCVLILGFILASSASVFADETYGPQRPITGGLNTDMMNILVQDYFVNPAQYGIDTSIYKYVTIVGTNDVGNGTKRKTAVFSSTPTTILQCPWGTGLATIGTTNYGVDLIYSEYGGYLGCQNAGQYKFNTLANKLLGTNLGNNDSTQIICALTVGENPCNGTQGGYYSQGQFEYDKNRFQYISFNEVPNIDPNVELTDELKDVLGNIYPNSNNPWGRNGSLYNDWQDYMNGMDMGNKGYKDFPDFPDLSGKNIIETVVASFEWLKSVFETLFENIVTAINNGITLITELLTAMFIPREDTLNSKFQIFKVWFGSKFPVVNQSKQLLESVVSNIGAIATDNPPVPSPLTFNYNNTDYVLLDWNLFKEPFKQVRTILGCLIVFLYVWNLRNRIPSILGGISDPVGLAIDPHVASPTTLIDGMGGMKW